MTKTTGGTSCARYILLFLNIIFLLCGLAVFVVGLVFKYAGSRLGDEIIPALEFIQIGGIDFYTLINGLAIIFIVVGGVILLFAVVGCCGAFCMSQSLLIIYAILVGLVLGLQIAGVALFFFMRDAFEENVREGLEEPIFRANQGSESNRFGMDFLFDKFDCCHVTGNRLNNTEVCTKTSHHYTKDCYHALHEWMKGYQNTFVAVGIICIVTQVVLIVSSCSLCRAIEHTDRVAK